MIVGIVIAVIVVLLVLWAVGSYNSLVALRNRVANGWAQIDVQLKQRADLVPNLVETVKGYAAHESEVFTQATEARAGAVAAVSLRACESGPGGFQDYLGERYDAPTATWRELYGKKLRVTVGLDLYAPAEGGEAACQRAFDRMAAAFHSGGPPGLKVRSLSRGEGRFDEGQGLFCCPVEAVCEAWLYAETDGSGAFLRFEVKGERI